MKHRYVIALGSNVRHHKFGRPRNVLAAALRKLAKRHVKVMAVSPIIASEPVGPSLRRYANGAALVKSKLDPEELLLQLKHLERKFGRRSGGQRWTSRVLDLDIVLWDGGSYASDDLTIPHKLFRERDFVLRPVNTIVPKWRDPLSGLSVAQLTARLTRRRPLPR